MDLGKVESVVKPEALNIEDKVMFNLTYGLFVLTAKDEKDNGCIINTVTQIANVPNRISISVNKQNYTHDIILKTKEFNVSILSQEVPFSVFERFGFASGRDTDKLKGFNDIVRSQNGLIYLNKYANAFLSARVIGTVDVGSHTLFIADVLEGKVLNSIPSVTYDYYFKNIKPKPQNKKAEEGVWVCSICGYRYDEKVEGVKFSDLPEDWTCPLCKHPKSDFELE